MQDPTPQTRQRLIAAVVASALFAFGLAALSAAVFARLAAGAGDQVAGRAPPNRLPPRKLSERVR